MFYKSFRARHDVIAVKPRFGDAFLQKLSVRAGYRVIAVKPRFGDAFLRKRVRSQEHDGASATLAVDMPGFEPERRRRGRPRTRTVRYKHFLVVAADLLIAMGKITSISPQEITLAVIRRLAQIFTDGRLHGSQSITFAENLARYFEPRNNHVFWEFHGGQIESRGRSKGPKRDPGIAGLASFAAVREYVLDLADTEDLITIRPALSYDELMLLYLIKVCQEEIRRQEDV